VNDAPGVKGALGRVLVVGATLSACSSDEARPPPPPVVGPGIDNPLGCAELRASAVLKDDQLIVDGGTPACAASGLVCPLEETPELLNVCASGGRAHAVCVGNGWTLRCTGDAG
jgi:hypothetical protein